MNSNRISLFTFSIFAAVILVSCNKADDVGDEIDLIEIQFLQRFVEERTEPFLLCKGGSFGCNGVAIAFEFDKTGEVIYLNFGSTYGADCSGSYNRYPAYTYVYLGNLESKNYLFEITNKGQTLHSMLHVENGKYTLSNGIGSTVTFKEDPQICHLAPQDALWGYVRSNPASNADYFLDSLQSLNAVSYLPLLEDGDYYYFRIHYGIVMLNLGEDSTRTPFILKSDLDTATLRNIMSYYCQIDILEDIHLTTGGGHYVEQY